MTDAPTLGAALAAVLLAFAGAAAADLAGRPRPAHALRLLACLAAAGFAGGAVSAGPVRLAFGTWMEVGGASLGFDLRADGPAAAALGAAAVVGLLYPLAQPAIDGVHRALITVAAVGVALLSCAADWLPLLVGWEIAVAALLVTAARSGDVSEAGARRLLLLTRIGSVALMAAAAASLAGGGLHEGNPWAEPAAGLLLLAAVIGLGVWPVHQWILEASASPAAAAEASVLAVAGASLLTRAGPLAGALQEVVFGVGLAAAVAASAAALASYGLQRVPGWIAVAQSGLVAAAAAADPIAGWLVLSAALGARLCLAAGIGLVKAALPAVERLDQLGGLGRCLPAARWMCLAAVLVPVFSLTGLWGQALLMKHAYGGYGPAGMAAALGPFVLAVLSVGRLALAPFPGAVPPAESKEMVRPALPIAAGSVSAGLVLAALPALAWLRLPAPSMDGVGLAAAANAGAVGIAVLIWRRGLKPASRPASAARRLAAGGFGAGAAQQGAAVAAISLGRGLWTFVDGAVLGAAWGALGLVLRGAGWTLARVEHAGRQLWAAALAAGVVLVILWSMGGR